MNERIQELADQCYHRYSEYNIDLEKFAELIFRECLDIVEGEDDGSADTKSVRLAMIRIKTHFGVEE